MGRSPGAPCQGPGGGRGPCEAQSGTPASPGAAGGLCPLSCRGTPRGAPGAPGLALLGAGLTPPEPVRMETAGMAATWASQDFRDATFALESFQLCVVTSFFKELMQSYWAIVGVAQARGTWLRRCRAWGLEPK